MSYGRGKDMGSEGFQTHGSSWSRRAVTSCVFFAVGDQYSLCKLFQRDDASFFAQNYYNKWFFEGQFSLGYVKQPLVKKIVEAILMPYMRKEIDKIDSIEKNLTKRWFGS